MAGYALVKFIAATIPTAANLNKLVQAINWWQGTPASGDTERPQADLFQNVAQSIANSTVTAVLFDSEDLDTANGHSTSTNTSRWTCPAGLAGWHDVDGTGVHGSNATGYRQTQLRINGATVIGYAATPAVSGNATGQSVHRKWFFNVGDYVELTLFQNSGGSLSTPVGPGCTLNVTMCRAQ